MAENKLEGFEDFDNILSEGEGGAAGVSGQLDDVLGKEGGGGAGGGGDSELDSFFEDLSTIDDLEVVQEEKPAAAPAPAAAAAAPVERERPAPKPKAAKPPRAKGKPGRLRKLIVYLLLLGVFGGGGYWFYLTYIAGEGKLPWPTIDTESLFPKKAHKPEAPPPPPVVEHAPRVAPRPEPPPPVHKEYKGPTFGIQVATCVFDSCVAAYRALLQEHNHRVTLKERSAQTEALEIYSRTAYTRRQSAQDMAERINREHQLEGHAFVVEEGNAFRISMGTFTDLSRANAVKDNLNQRYGGEIVFSHRLKAVPYSLRVLITGRYPTRAEAERALDSLRKLDRGLAGAFIIPNG
jgi:hypothetical protein